MSFDSFKHVPRGYVSEESKRTYTLLAGILGAVFFVAEMAVPFLAMIVLMPGLLVGGGMEFQQPDVEGAEFWRGDLWYVSRSESFQARRSSTSLWRLSPGKDAEPERVATLPFETPALLAAPDRLWVIGPDAVTWFRDGTLAPPVQTDLLGAFSRPYLDQGRPAVIQQRPDGYVPAVFEEGRWHPQAQVDVGKEIDPGASPHEVQAVAVGGRIEVFRRLEGTIYRRRGDDWKPVAKTSWNWVVREVGKDVLLVVDAGGREFQGRLTCLRLTTETAAEPILDHRLPLTTEFGVAGESADRYWLVTEGFPGSARAIEVRGGQVVSERKFGGGFPFGRGFLLMATLPHVLGLLTPIVLAIVLSALMRRHRVCEYGVGSGKVPFASLSRRAWAQTIDGILEFAPAAAGGLYMMSRFADLFDPMEVFAGMGVVMAGMIWLIVLFFLFSYTEGRWGWTPGKWLCGIRVVGTDLEPCGFGRALLRNLLKIADGFFNFLVGLLVAALSENWQRVGDMAARTIVIRVPRA